MGVVMGTGYAGPGWEWPKAANWHKHPLFLVSFGGTDEFPVSDFQICTTVIR